jgi:hypothetical protein
MAGFVSVLKNTHRNPANRMLHLSGLPVYIAGLYKIAGYFAGLPENPLEGIGLWTVAVSMFVSGHIIEGNVQNTTPVVLFRLLKSRRNTRRNRVHLG